MAPLQGRSTLRQPQSDEQLGMEVRLMKCPKCLKQMETIGYEGISIDRCTDCKGLWFDALEHERLLEMRGSESLDNGHPRLGKKGNKIEKITCPKCTGALMVEMVDMHQPHIWYEKCHICGGAYFDAGEFTDLKEKSLSDIFKRLFHKPRN